jgi:hypothetical protein
MVKVGRKRKEDGGLLDPNTNHGQVTFEEAVIQMFSTSPYSLDELCEGKITTKEWQGYRSNYRRGMLSNEKKMHLLTVLGFEVVSEQILKRK